MTDSKNPPIAKLDSAFDAFAAMPETENETGRVFAETAAALEEVQTEIAGEILPVIDDALAAAEALLDEADAEEKKEEEQKNIDSVKAQLNELDDSKEE